MKGHPFLLWLCILLLTVSVQAEDLGYTKTCSEVQAFTDLRTEKLKGFDDKIAEVQTKFPEATATREAYIQQLQSDKALAERRLNRTALANCDIASGRPHLIVDGRWSNAGDFLIPSLLWIYLTGALAWAGRDYLMKTRNPMDEILIDLPKALQSLGAGLIWFVPAFQEILSGAIRDNKVKP